MKGSEKEYDKPKKLCNGAEKVRNEPEKVRNGPEQVCNRAKRVCTDLQNVLLGILLSGWLHTFLICCTGSQLHFTF